MGDFSGFENVFESGKSLTASEIGVSAENASAAQRPIILATRGSALALVQAKEVQELLEKELEKRKIDRAVELSIIKTHGDKDRVHALVSIGGKGLFVRSIEEELIAGRADIAVHSGKDLPYDLADGLTIAGVPKAADFRDVLIFRNDLTIDDLRKMSSPVIGTGSPRRRIEIKRMLPGANFKENRGNIPTRIRKLREGQFDAILLAQAGLDRLPMDLSDLTVHPLPTEECLPAACQGILAAECREEDEEMADLLRAISDSDSRMRFLMERTLFTAMKADCSMAVGAHAELLPGDSVRLTAMYEGRRAAATANICEWRAAAENLAQKVMERSEE